MLHDSDGTSIGERLAQEGRVVMLSTRGRVSGRTARAAVGFVEQPDGSILVAAGSPSAQWALNLAAHPILTAAWAGRTGRFRAEALDGSDFAATISALILRYGTPAEKLGRGPAFRLHPEPGHSTDG
jgi:deazaflavin-dependent oxidoreductase (nitroreductase family)